MKKLICMLFLMCGVLLFGQTSEKIEDLQFVQGTLTTMDAPFTVRNCTFSQSGFLEITVLKEGRQLLINALKPGITEMQLTGETATKHYRITVVNNLRETLQNMSMDFEDIPELEAVMNGNKIVLKGEISNLEHWRLYQKYLPFYQGNIVNLVKFQPKAELLLLLQKALEAEGYTVIKNGEVPKHGEISIAPVGEVLEVTGMVYSPADVEKITQVLNAQSWISTTAASADKIRAMLNITVVPELIEVGVVFVGVDDTFLSQIGSTFFEKGIPFNAGITWQGGTDFHSWTDGGGFTIGTDLNTAVAMFGNNNNSIFRRAGFLTFRSNDPTQRTLHDGGTLKIRLIGERNSNLTDVDYGFQINIQGGLIAKDKVNLEMTVTMSTPVETETGDYDVKKFKVNTAFGCKLNETVALGGVKEMLHGVIGPAGAPFLRNVPILSWFFAKKTDNLHDKQTLILISPRLMSQARPIDIPPAQELREVEEESQNDLMDAKKKSHGWFEFLRW